MERQIQEYLSQKYQGHESFIENIIRPIFGEDKYETAWDVELLDSEELRGCAARTGIRSILRCGTIDIELNPIEVYDITVSDRIKMESNRVGVQELIRRVMPTYSGAFMIIHYDNEVKWDWRFTFCRLRDKNEFSNSKRYTFLLGPNQSCRTAAQNFQKLADLNQSIKIDDIQAAFDVEALSKEFFGKYKGHYEKFVEFITGKRYVKDGNNYVEVTTHSPHPVYYPAFGKSDKAVRDYVKLTLGRIILCHFIQKKGWLGVPVDGKWGDGDEQFMLNLFVKASDEQKNDFLEAVLEPFFFDGLDTDRRGNGDVFDSCVFGKVRIPYLNGGLFEKNRSDEVKVKFPKEYFSGLIEFFSEYNFTIDENDPDDAQVGIDPEMLSRIFENLLEDNKDKGAFYTPKEIVNYMCQESLVAYLVTRLGYEENLLRGFIQNPDIAVKSFSEEEKRSILDALRDVKICDPAIGSGAFPMGLLNILVRCQEVLSDEKRCCAYIKREIIRNNIYGVDIEKGAVDIARLRFWLSLVVDEIEPTPLPNLDFKIMQGNSLLEWYNGVDLSHLLEERDGDIIWQDEIDFKKRLSSFLNEYFDCEVHSRKLKLKNEIAALISNRLEDFSRRGQYGDKAMNMTNIKVESNNQFFLWHTWFADVFNRGGFDIFLGNPPYIRQEKLEHSYKHLLSSTYTEVGNTTADILVYFFGLGFKFLVENGQLIYITSNKFLKTKYGKALRNAMANSADVELIIDFFELPIFNAATDAAITKLSKRSPAHNTKYFPMKTLDNLDLFKRVTEDFQLTIKNESEWQFVEPEEISILTKISNDTISLKEFVNDRIYSGIKTGLNKAFILKDSTISSMFLASESATLVKPYAQSTDITRWGLKKKSIYFLATGFDIDIVHNYPTAYNYLNKFQPELSNRGDQGRSCYNLRSCAYYEDLERPKIIYIHTAKEHQFYLDTEGRYINNSCYMIGSESRYLLCFLNSKLFKYFKRIKFVAYGDGQEGGRCKLDYNKMITIPLKNNVDEKPFEDIVNTVFNIKKENPTSDVTEYENRIDKLIYQIYGLTSSEISIVEGANIE